MKTKRSLVTILAVVIAIIATAVEKPKMNVQSVNSDQLLVTFQNPNESNVEISIRNASGDIVYFKKSQKPIASFNMIFDVENLENGDYTIKLQANGTMLEKEISINSNKIRVGNTEEYSVPYFSFNGENLVVTHLNFENKKYRLSIFDENGLVYKTSLKNSSPLNPGFNMTNLKQGAYKVILHSDNNEFAYKFEKEN